MEVRPCPLGQVNSSNRKELNFSQGTEQLKLGNEQLKSGYPRDRWNEMRVVRLMKDYVIWEEVSEGEFQLSIARESPTLFRGYINDENSTRTAFSGPGSSCATSKAINLK